MNHLLFFFPPENGITLGAPPENVGGDRLFLELSNTIKVCSKLITVL